MQICVNDPRTLLWLEALTSVWRGRPVVPTLLGTVQGRLCLHLIRGCGGHTHVTGEETEAWSGDLGNSGTQRVVWWRCSLSPFCHAPGSWDMH